MKQKTSNNIAIACLSLDLLPDEIRASKQVPTDIQLTPAGYFRAVDGRPADLDQGWFIDASVAAVLIAQANSEVNDYVIDYEHQTLHKEKNGQPAPAAGWFKRLDWREGKGLFAIDVKWTPAAEQAMLNGEYRYLSPVFTYESKTGRLLSMKMAAITNSPGLGGMQSLAALSLDQFNSMNNQEEPSMKKLLALLGLADSASEDDAVAALTALQTKATESDSQIAALTAQVDADPDPAKYVPIDVVSGLQSQIAALTAGQAQANVDATVTKAIQDGKLLPVQKDWATKLGNSNMAALTEYLGNQNPIAALTGKQADEGQTPPAKTAALTAEQKQAADLLGIPHTDYLAQLKSEQGA